MTTGTIKITDLTPEEAAILLPMNGLSGSQADWPHTIIETPMNEGTPQILRDAIEARGTITDG